MADNVVEIVIKATDKATAELEAIRNEFKSVRGEVETFAAKASQAGEQVGGTAKLVNFASTLYIAQQVFQTLGQVAQGAIQAGRSFIEMNVQAAQSADEIKHMAAASGLAVEDFSRLKYTAEQNETSVEALRIGLRFLQRNLVEAREGSKQAAEGFDALGLSAAELSRLGASEQMARVAEAIGKIEDPAKRSSIAIKIMGRSGTELLPILLSGADSFREMGAEADRLGITMSSRAVAALDAFGDAVKSTQDTTDGLKRNIAEALSPALTRLTLDIRGQVAGLSGWVEKNRQLIGLHALSLAQMAEDVGLLARVTLGTKGWAASLEDVSRGIAGFLPGGTLALNLFNKWFSSAKEVVDQRTARIKPFELDPGVFTDMQKAEGELVKLKRLREDLQNAIASTSRSPSGGPPFAPSKPQTTDFLGFKDLTREQLIEMAGTTDTTIKTLERIVGPAHAAGDSIAGIGKDAKEAKQSLEEYIAEFGKLTAIVEKFQPPDLKLPAGLEKIKVEVQPEIGPPVLRDAFRIKVDTTEVKEADAITKALGETLETTFGKERAITVKQPEVRIPVEEQLRSIGLVEEQIDRLVEKAIDVKLAVQEAIEATVGLNVASGVLGETAAEAVASIAIGFEAWGQKAKETYDLVAAGTQVVTDAMDGFVQGFGDRFGELFEAVVFKGKASMKTLGDFIIGVGKLVENVVKQIMVELAKAIARAIVVKVVLSALGIGGGGTVSEGDLDEMGVRSGGERKALATGGEIRNRLADGGAILRAQVGMVVPGAVQSFDRVPALLAPGEVVLPTINGSRPADLLGSLGSLAENLKRLMPQSPAPALARSGNTYVNISAFNLDSMRDMVRHGDLSREQLRAFDLGRA